MASGSRARNSFIEQANRLLVGRWHLIGWDPDSAVSYRCKIRGNRDRARDRPVKLSGRVELRPTSHAAHETFQAVIFFG